MDDLNAKATDELVAYDWQNHEWLLIDWFHTLYKAGELRTTFLLDMTWLSNFLTYFRSRAILGYSADTNGVWFAFWLEPVLSGAFCGVWIRQDHRHSTSALRLLSKAYDKAFEVFPVIIGLSKQAHLREIHRKLGYTHMGEVPQLWDNEGADVYYLTRNAWLNRKQRKAA